VEPLDLAAPAPNRVASAIRDGLLWLESQQKRNGRWKEESLLLEVTTTSQAALAFITAGFSQHDPVVHKAIAWLLGERVDKEVTHRFWRILPIIHFNESYREYIASDLTHLRESIEKGLKIDPRLNYRTFLLECLVYAKFKPDFDVSEDISVLQSATEKSCSEDALQAIWGCSILELSGHPPSRKIINAVSATVCRQVQSRNRLSSLDNNVSATSYCLLNIARSHLLRNRAEIEQLAHQCVEWLLVSQESTGNWRKEQALYGGNPGSAYTTSLAVRALLGYLVWRDSRAIAGIFVPDWRRNRRMELWATWAAVILATIAAMIVLFVIAKNFPEFLILLGVVSVIASKAEETLVQVG
jgi:hypothetical protein